MAWFDPRLKHSLSRPILINEYTFLKKIWRPDPIFTNSKSATFHKVELFENQDIKVLGDLPKFLHADLPKRGSFHGDPSVFETDGRSDSPL